MQVKAEGIHVWITNNINNCYCPSLTVCPEMTIIIIWCMLNFDKCHGVSSWVWLQTIFLKWLVLALILCGFLLCWGFWVTVFATFRRRVKRTLYDLYLSLICQQEGEETLRDSYSNQHAWNICNYWGRRDNKEKITSPPSPLLLRQPWSLEKSPPPIYPLCYWLYSSAYLKKIKAFCKKIATPGQGLGSAASKY